MRKNLEQRPERSDLIERNILPSSGVAPGIQSAQQELQKHMRKDGLEKSLAQRPDRDELVESQ